MVPSLPFSFLCAHQLFCYRRRYWRPCAAFLALLALHAFLLLAALHNLHSASPLLILCLLAHAVFIYRRFLRRWLISRVRIANFRVPRLTPHTVCRLKIILPSLVILLFVVWLLVDSVASGHHPNWARPRSLLGFLLILALCHLCSAHPSGVHWHPVLGGIFLQFAFGFLILRWPPGSVGFQWASNKVVNFLNFSYNGTRFVYGFLTGPPAICGMHEVFIFSALQIIIYFGAFAAILYHFGIIQAVLSRIACVVQFTIGTTAAESLNAAGCVFLGQTESNILIGPAFATMTASEIHCVMTTGYACIAGSLFAAYIAFGNCPIHLLSATLMNASISLGVSKLVYPELEQSKQTGAEGMNIAPRDNDETVFECISEASVKAVRFVLAIGANLVVSIALLALLNAIIAWAGQMIGMNGLSFNQILGFCFFPLAWVMGVSDAPDPQVYMDETMKVAELMGMKTALNEFIAYQRLNQMMASGALKGARANMAFLATGTQIGLLTLICPEKRPIFAKVAFRTFISGVSACFLTACVAGMLVASPTLCHSTIDGGKCLDVSKLIINNNSTQS